MKKMIALILCIMCVLSFVGCGNRIKEYKGTSLTDLSFRKVNYNGGFTREYIRVFACSGQDLRGQVMTGKRNGLLLDSLMKAPESRTIVT